MSIAAWLNLIVAVSLFFQPLGALIVANPVVDQRSIKTEAGSSLPQQESFHSLARVENEHPILPIWYKTVERAAPNKTVHTAEQPVSVVRQTITNGEDIVYLANSGQIGRTRNFSASLPDWESIIAPTSSLNGTAIYDFVLDPGDPYQIAFVVGNTGIWRTTNLNDRWPIWQNLRSMYDITASLPAGKYDPGVVVSRIAGDVSKPGYYFVVLGGVNYQDADAWVGYTFDYGNTWSWVALPSNYYGGTPYSLGTRFSGLNTGLAVSQDGSGRIWVGAWPYSFTSRPRILYSEDYGSTWTIIYKPDTSPGSSFPTSLYYSHGTLFATIIGPENWTTC